MSSGGFVLFSLLVYVQGMSTLVVAAGRGLFPAIENFGGGRHLQKF